MPPESWIDALVAIAAVGGLITALLERRARLRLERQLHDTHLSLQVNVTNSKLALSIKNAATATAKITGFTIFVDDDAFLLNTPESWVQLLKRIGLSSPEHLELDAHCFELPLSIGPQAESYLIRGEFEQNDADIWKAIGRWRFKITSVSPLGDIKSKITRVAPYPTA